MKGQILDFYTYTYNMWQIQARIPTWIKSNEFYEKIIEVVDSAIAKKLEIFLTKEDNNIVNLDFFYYYFWIYLELKGDLKYFYQEFNQTIKNLKLYW